jgi:hypothetical protein
MLLAVLALVIIPTWLGLAYARRKELGNGA